MKGSLHCYLKPLAFLSFGRIFMERTREQGHRRWCNQRKYGHTWSMEKGVIKEKMGMLGPLSFYCGYTILNILSVGLFIFLGDPAQEDP